jgi:two-component system response regulator LytT
MKKIKILVVEDEMIIADHICDTLESLGYNVLEPVISFTEALESIKKEEPDMAILDINLSGKKTGIDLAKVIREKYDFPFIFLSSNSDSETINLAKEVNPPAYLVKPFTKNDLFTTLEIALHNFSRKNAATNDEGIIIKNSIFIKDKGLYKKIPFDEILYLKSAHVYVEIYLKSDKKVVVRMTLNEILGNLDNGFLKVHRSYIVNTKYLVELKQTSAKILNEEVPVGKKYRDDILKRINLV